jgi:hypothetical protein
MPAALPGNPPVSQLFRTARLPALLSLGLLLPFVLLETVQRGRYGEPFPYLLFTVLWLLQLAFLLLLKPVLQGVFAGKLFSQPGLLVMCAACLALITWAWVSLMADQMPCFLGIPACD